MKFFGLSSFYFRKLAFCLVAFLTLMIANITTAQTQLSFEGSKQVDTFYPAWDSTKAHDGNFNTFNHTARNSGAWWQGELSEEAIITKITIHNRSASPFAALLNGSRVYIDTRDMGTVGSSTPDWSTLKWQTPQPITGAADGSGNADNPIVINVTPEILGKYVMLYNFSNYLHVGEVIVEGYIAAPEITSDPSATATAGEAFSYTIIATDDNPSETVTLSVDTNQPGFPAWLSFNNTTNTLSGTPTEAGTHIFDVVATDSIGKTSTQTLTITVSATPPSGDLTVTGDLDVQGTSTLGPTTLDVAGGDIGPAGSADYAMAPFLLQHDSFNLGLDGDQLSTDAAPFIIQNTNLNGSIIFQTGGDTSDRLSINAYGTITMERQGDIPMYQPPAP